jgi:hypothetical protein
MCVSSPVDRPLQRDALADFDRFARNGPGGRVPWELNFYSSSGRAGKCAKGYDIALLLDFGKKRSKERLDLIIGYILAGL